MEEAHNKKRPGRPRKKPEERADPTQPLSVRLTVELRNKLEAEANRAGRTMSSEIALRLEASFEPSLEAVLLTARLKESDQVEARLKVLDRLEANLEERAAAAQGKAPADQEELSEIMEQLAECHRQASFFQSYLTRIRADIIFYSERVASFIEDMQQQQQRWDEAADNKRLRKTKNGRVR